MAFSIDEKNFIKDSDLIDPRTGKRSKLRKMTPKEYSHFIRGLNLIDGIMEEVGGKKVKGKHYDYWLPAPNFSTRAFL